MERYSDPQSFAREVNLPLLGIVHVAPIPAGAPAAALLAADVPDEMKPVVELLTQTRKSLTLRSLFMTGFPHDTEFFAAGLALARQWSRQGLKVAVVDLDYRHPTIVRPRPDPNEGYVDALEYGCSFQRIAWELVADTLWLVGPGSHPPDDRRFAEHPDWARVMRIFSARVDITLFLAPFLDRKGFTGSLSKRMDGVLLAASVRRSGRAALRDSFLELWGSDAPMIGCLGISVPYDVTPRGEVELTAGPPAPTPEWTFPAPDAPLSPRMPAPASTPRTPLPTRTPPRARESGETAPQSLVSRLHDEVRSGQLPRAGRPRPRGILLLALILVALAGAGAYVTFRAMHRAGSRAGASDETMPAGTERVLPADLGTEANPNGLPRTEGTALEGGTGPDDASGSVEPPAGGSGGAGDAGAGSSSAQGSVPQAANTSPSGATEALESAPTKRAPQARGALTYQVHVASFRSESKVRDLVKRLRGRGADAWYARATDQPGWYRVFVGHYATHEEAAQKAAWLLDRGWVERARAYPDNER